MGQVIDDRGVLSFIDNVDLSRVKRLYAVENFSTYTVRALHGHMHEEKFVIVVKGSIILVTAKINFVQADPEQKPYPSDIKRFVLSDKKLSIHHIEAGRMNGFRALEPDTKVLFFSTSTLDESMSDDIRWDWDYLGKDIWDVRNR